MTSPPVDFEPRFAEAAAEFDRACFDCVKAALDAYERLMGEASVRARATEGALRSAIVLAVRERELGTIDTGYLARARELARADAVLDGRYGAVLEAVELVLWRHGSQRRDLYTVLHHQERARRDDVKTRLAAVSAESNGDPVFTYVATALVCEESPSASHPSMLMAFRAALCQPRDPRPLTALLAREPGFLELHALVGDAALGRSDLTTAEVASDAALAWRRDWPTAALMRAHVLMAVEDFDAAFAAYSDVLAMVPGQEDALLGKGRALSYLGRPEEAIGTIEILLAPRRWFVGDALYWRAWNRTQLNQLEDAWRDVEDALRLISNNDIHRLAGIIAMRRGQFAVARGHFEEAIRRHADDCLSRFYLAGVYAEQRSWVASGGGYGEASGCYEKEEQRLAGEFADVVRSTSMPSERRERVMSRLERGVAEAGRLRVTSWFNAAVGFVNASRFAEARPFADRAAGSQMYRDRARELVALIEKAVGGRR